MDKKTILVAGAGKGIGRAAAQLAYEHGHKVIAVSRTAEDLKDLPYKTIVADLLDSKSVYNLKELNLGNIEAVINSTGKWLGKTPLSQNWISEYMRIINENTLPALNLYNIFLSQFRKRKKGHFVHVSSAALDFYDPSEYAYCSAKAALDSLTLCMQNEDKERNVLHHTLRASLTDTPFARKACPKILDWTKYYTTKETASYLIDIIENPENYPEPIVKIPIRPIRNKKED